MKTFTPLCDVIKNKTKYNKHVVNFHKSKDDNI